MTTERIDRRKEWRGKLGKRKLKTVKYKVFRTTTRCGKCGRMLSAYEQEDEIR